MTMLRYWLVLSICFCVWCIVVGIAAYLRKNSATRCCTNCVHFYIDDWRIPCSKCVDLNHFSGKERVKGYERKH